MRHAPTNFQNFLVSSWTAPASESRAKVPEGRICGHAQPEGRSQSGDMASLHESDVPNGT